MLNESTQQPNQDQDQHDKWLESRTPEQLDRLAARVKGWVRSKDKSAQTSSEQEQKKL
jgi:hypothetical protein